MIDSIPAEYDKFGKIKYNPDLHDRQGQPWDDEEKEYLINWYNIIGLEEMSLALGRTESTVSTKVVALRKKGLMSKQKTDRLNRELTTRRVNSYANRAFKRKINEDDVRNIIELKKTKTTKEIAKIYNVSTCLVDLRISELKKTTTKELGKAISVVCLNNKSVSV